VQGSAGAYNTLSYLLPLTLPPRHVGGRDQVREMREEIAEEVAEECATDGVEGDVLTNCIAC